MMDMREYCQYGILPFLLVVSSSAFTEISSEAEVWGVAGGRVELPCEPKLKEPNDHPVLVLWYLSSNTTPVYSYDARTGDFSSGNRWADMHTFGNRAYFSSLAVPPSLILEPLRSDDGGIYSCRIDYRRSPSTTAITNLTVIVPPGPPVILWNGVGVVGSVGPLQEHSQVSLICRSNGGSPPPKLTWWWRGSLLSHQTSNVTFNQLSRSPKVESTVWLRATRGYHGALLTCHAHPPTPEKPSRSIILQPRTASVSLNITLPPLEITVSGMRGPVSAGTALQLECRSVGSNPPAELTWWRGHSHLTEVIHSIHNGGNVTTATLTVMTNREHDGATFACTASNPLLPNSPVTRTVRLEVYYPPVATLRLGRAINSSIIQEGNDIYFECDVRANPEVQRIDWTHNGVMLKHNLKAGIMMSGLSLALQKLSKSNSGSYTCIAYNSEGRNTSNALHLTVRHKPQCVGGPQAKIVGAARGTSTLLTCRVEAEPALVTSWEWVRIRGDNTEEKVPQKKVQSNGLTSSVRLTPVSQGDYGYVTCRATNEIGQQLEPCLVNFVPAGPPDPPTNCSATPVNRGQETTSLSIACHEGFDGGLPQEFHLEVQQEKEIIANLSSEFPEWVVDELIGGASLTIRVTSQNAHGKSEPLMLEVHTPLAQHREALDSSTKDKKTLLGATTLFGALVGVVVVLIILIIVSVIIARKAKPRPKNKPTIVSTTPVDSTWECYNPDLVSSAQQRHPNREALTASQQSLPSPRLHTLMQKHRTTHLPLNEQAHNCIQMHRKSLPHLLISNRDLKASKDMELQTFDLDDTGSDSNNDSDVESVIEVTHLATKGLTTSTKLNAGQYSSCSPLTSKTVTKGKALGSSANLSRSTQAISYEKEATKPLLTKDEKNISHPRIIHNLHIKTSPNIISASERTRILPKSPEKHRKDRSISEKDQLLGDQSVCQNKTAPDMTPPPKPPRIFNPLQASGLPPSSPEPQRRGSKLSLLDNSASAQKQNKKALDSKGESTEDNGSAPLAKDEVKEAYQDSEKGTKPIRQNGIPKRKPDEAVRKSPSKETSI
ncbi:uncharacterized protein [Palaemon carinicauda]|uniref:uncharacterized protein n=1 Tax=Palaemon carinicauda TaxID=392227 RepID=UPI0035B69F68